MPPRKKRKVARSPEELALKRAKILDATMQLLITKGYTKTTMSDVAIEASMGRGTVYWHFKSKDDLFYSLLKREVASIDEGIADALNTDAPALVQLESVVRATFHLYGEAPSMFQAFMSVLSGADEELERRLLSMFSSMYGKYNKLIEDLLERGKKEGDVRVDLDSHVVAAAIVVMLDTLFLQVWFGHLEQDPYKLSDSIISMMRRGYGARPG